MPYTDSWKVVDLNESAVTDKLAKANRNRVIGILTGYDDTSFIGKDWNGRME